jgi:hypothetical protein
VVVVVATVGVLELSGAQRALEAPEAKRLQSVSFSLFTLPLPWSPCVVVSVTHR